MFNDHRLMFYRRGKWKIDKIFSATNVFSLRLAPTNWGKWRSISAATERKNSFRLIIETRKLTVASDESSKILVSGGFLLLLNSRLQSLMLLFDADVECRSSSLWLCSMTLSKTSSFFRRLLMSLFNCFTASDSRIASSCFVRVLSA